MFLDTYLGIYRTSENIYSYTANTYMYPKYIYYLFGHLSI